MNRLTLILAEAKMRAIATTGFDAVTPSLDLGPVSQLQWIEIEQLVVDPHYQREILGAGRRNIVAIAGGFRWSHFAPVIVAPIEGGRYAIVDGQHRTTAAAIVGIKSVPCLVILADRNEQAKAFRAVNAQTTRMHPTAMFRAAVAAGDPAALAAFEMAADAEVTICTKPVSAREMKARHTLAVKQLQMMAEQDKACGTLALRLCALNSEDGTNVLRASILRAIFDCLIDHPEWRSDTAFLVSVFEQIDLDDQLAEASSRAAKARGTTAGEQLYVYFVTLLEKAFAKRRAS